MRELSKQWRDYLQSIGFEEPLMDRVKTIINLYSEIVPIDSMSLFVSEYRDNDKRRIYDSLWLCNNELVSEASDFISQNNFDCVQLSRTTRWNVAMNFGALNIDDESRMTLEIRFEHGIIGVMKASGSNCSTLLRILEQYIAPSMTNNSK